MVSKVEMYQTGDGTLFKTKEEAQRHDQVCFLTEEFENEHIAYGIELCSSPRQVVEWFMEKLK